MTISASRSADVGNSSAVVMVGHDGFIPTMDVVWILNRQVEGFVNGNVLHLKAKLFIEALITCFDNLNQFIIGTLVLG